LHQKLLQYYLPGLHWWLGLNASEQAAWAAVVAALLGAAGGFAAAWASFRAARLAIELAKLPVKQQADFKRVQAQVIAYAISTDLENAYSAALQAAQFFTMSHFRRDIESVSDLAKTSRIEGISMLERFLNSLDCFGAEDGAIVASAVASIFSYNTTLAGATDSLDQKIMSKIDVTYHITLAEMCQLTAERTVTEIGKSLNVLRRYGLVIYADNGVDNLFIKAT
jgi:hypothetical protein